MSIPKHNFTSSQLSAWRQGTYDDRETYSGYVHAAIAENGTYERVDHPSGTYFIEKKALRDFYHLYLLSPKDDRKPRLVLKVVNTSFSFPPQLLDVSTSDLFRESAAAIVQDTRTISSSTVALNKLREIVNTFSWSHHNEAVDVVRIYKKYLDTRVFDSKSLCAELPRSPQYSFCLQAACVAFGSVVRDNHFLNLALQEIAFAWTQPPVDVLPLTFWDYQAAFKIRPLSDPFLYSVARAYSTLPASHAGRYPDSFHIVHRESWKKLLADRANNIVNPIPIAQATTAVEDADAINAQFDMFKKEQEKLSNAIEDIQTQWKRYTETEADKSKQRSEELERYVETTALTHRDAIIRYIDNIIKPTDAVAATPQTTQEHVQPVPDNASTHSPRAEKHGVKRSRSAESSAEENAVRYRHVEAPTTYASDQWTYYGQTENAADHHS